MIPLRLLSIDARTPRLERSALARVIERAQVDIACVHGAPSLLRWRSHCAALGREAGLVVVSGGRTGGGNLLLSTLGVTVAATHDLSFAGTHGARPPGATVASLARLGGAFVFAGARLSTERDGQRAQVTELLRAVERIDPATPPAIICVDDAGSGAALELADGRTVAAPGVFVDPRIEVGETSGGVVELNLPG